MGDIEIPTPESLTPVVRAFLDDATDVLQRDHVLPRPRYQPWVEVGRDYFGGDLRELPTFEALEKAIEATDSRFGEETPLRVRDFAHGYVFDALEFFVAEVTREVPDPLSSTVTALLEGLALPRERVSAWMVTDITTAGETALRIADVVVHPAPDVGAGTRLAMLRILKSVFGVRAEQVDQDRLPHPFADAGLLVASYEHATSRPDDVEVPPSTRRIGDLVLAVRLLFAATAHPVYELRGQRVAVGGHRPYVHEFEGAGQASMSAGLDARRPAKLDTTHEPGIMEIKRLVGAVQDGPPSPLQTALGRYQLSHQKFRWVDKVIDLTIALEAALAGKEQSGMTFRLQVRAGALLGTDQDPAQALFDDVKRMYGLRSRFVHGGALSSGSINKQLSKLRRVPQGDHLPRFQHDAAVDRLRDIVRRSILCRLLLAEHAPEVWDVGGNFHDSILIDQMSGTPLREVWHRALADLGVPDAAQAAAPLRTLGEQPQSG